MISKATSPSSRELMGEESHVIYSFEVQWRCRGLARQGRSGPGSGAGRDRDTALVTGGKAAASVPRVQAPDGRWPARLRAREQPFLSRAEKLAARS